MILRPRVRLRRPRRLTPPPGNHRILLLPLAAALLATWLLWPHGHVHGDEAGPTSISGYRAGATRDLASCLRLVIGVDESGSMAGYAEPRDAALSQLFSWIKLNLRADDEIAIIDFAAEARPRLTATRVDQLAALPGPTTTRDGADTDLWPVLRAIGQLPHTACETALVLISDAQIADLPADATAGRTALAAARIDKVRLLVPGTTIAVDPQWTVAFPAATPRVFDGQDRDATGLAFGRTVVDLTGQSLDAIKSGTS